MDVDPFTKVYDKICKEFEAVGAKVLVSWNSSTDPEPSEAVKIPELQLRPTQIAAQLGSKSSMTDVMRTFQVLINSGDQRLGVAERGLFPMEWRLLGALFRCKYETLDELEHNGQNYVQRVEVATASSGLSDSTLNRGIKGWTALWDIVVHMQFSDQDFAL